MDWKPSYLDDDGLLPYPPNLLGAKEFEQCCDYFESHVSSFLVHDSIPLSEQFLSAIAFCNLPRCLAPALDFDITRGYRFGHANREFLDYTTRKMLWPHRAHRFVNGRFDEASLVNDWQSGFERIRQSLTLGRF
jgi:hypothetical protein